MPGTIRIVLVNAIRIGEEMIDPSETLPVHLLVLFHPKFEQSNRYLDFESES